MILLGFEEPMKTVRISDECSGTKNIKNLLANIVGQQVFYVQSD
jgi:hypothetical protein